jgi:DNA-binding winged helix-turn-helix (wHTH) protein
MSGSVRRLSFGRYVLDGQSRELLRGPELTSVHLSRKAMDMLLLLVSERPRAVSKQEIFERIWPDVCVSDATLASVISEIRAALGERGRRARYLRTVHGFGYAFSAHVLEATTTHEPQAVRCWLMSDAGQQPLLDGEYVLGRCEPSAIVLASPTVSRQHARIVVDADAAILTDLGSKNGTFLNEQPVASAQRLADGDRIRIGVFSLTFRTIDGTTAALGTSLPGETAASSDHKQ